MDYDHSIIERSYLGRPTRKVLDYKLFEDLLSHVQLMCPHGVTIRLK